MIKLTSILKQVLKEEDDEWDLEAGFEWDVKDLTKGDIITPDMWDLSSNPDLIDELRDYININNNQKIFNIFFDDDNIVLELMDEINLDRKYNDLDFINDLLKSQFKIYKK